MSIRNFMSDDHRHCDDLFAIAEQAAADGELAHARNAFGTFQMAMLHHFIGEEQTLFPAFEKRTGMRMGPTQVMRMEHEQMRELMVTAVDALVQEDAEAFLGQLETLLIMMQQHNMKEENVLYPMCDQHLAADQAGLIERLQGDLQTA